MSIKAIEENSQLIKLINELLEVREKAGEHQIIFRELRHREMCLEEDLFKEVRYEENVFLVGETVVEICAGDDEMYLRVNKVFRLV